MAADEDDAPATQLDIRLATLALGPPETGSRLPPADPARYHVVREFARGGLGRILAVDDRWLGRPVAVKEMLDSDETHRARFVREALVTARLQHPAIVPVYEAGTWPSGEPFFAMKLVKGRSLKEVIDEKKTLDERLALLPNVIAVVEALAYAHGERIIHRDLKPHNVLIGPFGETVVIDWGLAKDLSFVAPVGGQRPTTRNWPVVDPERGPDAERTLDEVSAAILAAAVSDGGSGDSSQEITVDGEVMGTPKYMPPEQARGQPLDERADVYALGAMLYHVLTGAAPYEGHTTAVLYQIVAGPPVSVEQRQPGVPAELAAIVRKAMAHRRDDRYPTAKELADDLLRFTTGQLVSSHRYSRAMLVRRWLKRHVVALALAGGLVVGLGAVGALRLHDVVAERNLLAADASALTLTQARASLGRDPTAALAWTKTYPATARDWASARAVALDAHARGVARHVLAHDETYASLAAFSPDGTIFASVGDATDSDGQVLRAWDLASGRLLVATHAAGTVRAVATASDGKPEPVTTATGLPAWQAYAHVALGDAGAVGASGEDEHAATGAIARFVADAPLATDAVSPDGRAVASARADGHVLLQGRDGERLLVGHAGHATMLLFSPDGQHLVSAGVDGTVRVWDRATGAGRVLAPTPAGGARSLTVSADGHLLVAAAAVGGGAVAWDLGRRADEGIVLRRHEREALAVAVSRDGGQVAMASSHRGIQLWDVRRATVRLLIGAFSSATTLEFTPDGRYLASGGADGRVLLWETGGDGYRVLRGHTGPVEQVAFSGDGRWLASVSADRTARIWDLADITRTDAIVLRANESDVERLAVSPDGAHFASADRDGLILLRSAAAPTASPLRLAGHHGRVLDLAFSPDGRHLASASADHTVRLWDVSTGAATVLDGHTRAVWDVAFAPDGRHLASAGADGMVRLSALDASGLATTGCTVLGGERGDVRTIAFSPDGRRLATAGADGVVHIWDVGSGTAVASWRGHADVVFRIVFSHDGTRLASASGDGSVRVWDAATGTARLALPLGAHALDVAFSPDDRHIATAADDGSVQLVDLPSGSARRLVGHDGRALRVAFSPDGTLLATGGWDGSVRLWDVTSGELEEVRRHDGWVLDLAWFPSGRTLASASEDNTVRLWTVAGHDRLPAEPASLLRWMTTLSTAVLDASRAVLRTPS